MNTTELVNVFYNILRENNYHIVDRSNLLSPYFKGEFNLSGAHSYLVPAVQDNNKRGVDKIGVVDLVVRDVDLEIVGTSKSHLLLFEMGVFGCFGYMENIETEIYSQFKVLFDFFNIIGIDNSKVIITICQGGEYLDKKLEMDDLSYRSLVNAGFDATNIITTMGRRNFMLSRGIDRLAGFNVEFFIEKDGSYIEIGSSNIYKFLNKLTFLKETINNGVGCGIGFERLSYVLSDKKSVLEIEPFNHLYSEIVNSKDIKGVFLIKDKLLRSIELTKAIIFILNDGIKTDKSPQGKKLQKYIAKVKSELKYLAINNDFFLFVYKYLITYYSSRYKIEDIDFENFKLLKTTED
jgi:alanyl-tRNA synthetase